MAVTRRRAAETENTPSSRKMETIDSSTVHFNIVLYSLAYWIQASVLPYVSKQLGASTTTFGQFQTFFALVQLLGGPLYGRFGDLFGGKKALIVAFLASALSYFMLGFASTIAMLFLSRLPTLLQHCMQGGQLVISSVVVGKDRSAALGRLSLSYGVGMILGPLIGGQIAKLFGEQSAAVGAGFISLVSVALVMILPDREQMKDESEEKEQKEDRSLFDIKEILRVTTYPGVFAILGIKTMLALPFGMYNSLMSLLMIELFGLSSEDNSYVMSYVAAVAILANGIGISLLVKYFKESMTMFISAVAVLLAFAALIFVDTLPGVIACTAPIVGGGAMLSVMLTSRLTIRVPAEDTGATLGIDMAINSAVRTLTPTLGTYLLEAYGMSNGFIVLGSFGAACCFVMLAVLYNSPSIRADVGDTVQPTNRSSSSSK